MDDASSDSSRRRNEILAPLYSKSLTGLPETMPVVFAGKLKFASVDSSGKVGKTFRDTAAPQKGIVPNVDGDGVWCELFADVVNGDTRLAVFSGVQNRDDVGDNPKEMLTFHWKTKALRRGLGVGPKGEPLHALTMTYFFSAVHDRRFRGAPGGDGRKYTRVDRVALIAPSEDDLQNWLQKLQACLEMIPEPIWMGPLQKRPTMGGSGRRAMSRPKKRFFVLDGANIIYYTDSKLLEEKGKLTLTTSATIARGDHNGVPNFTLTVGNRTLVAESLQTDTQLRLADVENWVLKIQQTIDALAELEAQLLAEAVQPQEPQVGTGADPDDDEVFYYDENGQMVSSKARAPADDGLGAESHGSAGFDGFVKVYPFLASPTAYRWHLKHARLHNGSLELGSKAGIFETQLKLTPFSTVVANESLSKSKPLGLELAHPRSLLVLYGCEDDAHKRHSASADVHQQLSQQVNKQLLDLKFAQRGIADPHAYAAATTHYLVLEDIELDMGTRCNVMVNWCIASEPEFRQSTGTRWGTAAATWPVRRKYALNASHWSAPEGCTLVMEVVLLEPKPSSPAHVSADGVVDESYVTDSGTQAQTEPFSFFRGTFQHYVPLGDLDYNYSDEAKPLRTTVQFGSGQTLSFRAFLEPQHIITCSDVSFSVVMLDDASGSQETDAADKFLASLSGYQLTAEDVGVDVCNLYPQVGSVELSPNGDLVYATNDAETSSAVFPAHQFRLGQISEDTRLKFAFVDGRGKMSGMATVPGLALLRAVTTHEPATLFVDLRKQHGEAGRVKMQVNFTRVANFERAFRSSLDNRMQSQSLQPTDAASAASSAVSALSRRLSAPTATGQAAPLLDPDARVYFESWISKLPRSATGFAGKKKKLGPRAKRRFLTLDDGVLRYYTNASKVDLKGQMSLFAHTEVKEIEDLEFGLQVSNKSKSGPGISPSAAARRPLTFVCEDAEAFQNWKIVLQLAIHQLLAAAATDARREQEEQVQAQGLTQDVVPSQSGAEEGQATSQALISTDNATSNAAVQQASQRDVELQNLETERATYNNNQRLQQDRARLEQQQRHQQELDFQRQQMAQQQFGQQEFLRLRQQDIERQQQQLAEQQRQYENQQRMQAQQQQPQGGMAVNPYHVSQLGTQAAINHTLGSNASGVQAAANLYAGSKFSYQQSAAPRRRLSPLEEVQQRHNEEHQRKLDALERDRQAAAAQGIQLEAGDITTTTVINVDDDKDDKKKARRRRLWIAGASVLGVLLLLLLLFVVAMAMARLRVTATGVMIESDIPQFTRPPNAVSAALWLRGQAEYAFTNPGYLTVCVNHVDASFFYVDQAGVTPGAAPTLTKVTPASTVDLMFPRGGPQRNDRTIDTCVAPGSTVKLQIPFEVRVMLSPPLTQSIADDCSASAQRFAVDVLGSGASYIRSLPGIALPSFSLNHVENVPCSPDTVSQNAPAENPALPQPQPQPQQKLRSRDQETTRPPAVTRQKQQSLAP